MRKVAIVGLGQTPVREHWGSQLCTPRTMMRIKVFVETS